MAKTKPAAKGKLAAPKKQVTAKPVKPAKPTPTKLDATTLYPLLGASPKDPKVAALLTTLGCPDRKLRIDSDGDAECNFNPHGIVLTFEDRVVSSISLHIGATYMIGNFAGTLPAGLQRTWTFAEGLAAIGRPIVSQDERSFVIDHEGVQLEVLFVEDMSELGPKDVPLCQVEIRPRR